VKREAGRRFLDTNILIYSFMPDDPGKQEQARVIVAGALERHDSVISFQVVQEFLNYATRKPACRMGQVEAQQYLTHVLMPLCQVWPTAALYTDALSIASETGWSFYDSVIVSAAASAGCGVLLTEDLQTGRVVRGVEIRNPFAAER
jgi:predicted nucleic acid-binding protein